MDLFDKAKIHGEGDKPRCNPNTIDNDHLKDLRRRAGADQVRGTPLSSTPSIWYPNASKGGRN